MHLPAALLILACMSAGAASGAPRATSLNQDRPAASTAVTAAQVTAAVDRLGALEFPVRMEAARTVRRAEARIALPALLAAVAAHTDWYVRFRALVLLSGFNDPRTGQTMVKMLEERNDRLRAVAYAWFEHHPDPAVLPRLLNAVQREESEFVRPALTRALAAYGADGRVRDVMVKLVMQGQDLFRAVVIEALGEHRASYALQPIVEVAKLEGPLQDDAVLAIGRIGDKRGLPILAALQQNAPRQLQPSIAAAICLLGSNCPSHLNYLVETVKFARANPGHQVLLRAAAGGLAALATDGNRSAAAALFEQGVPARDPERAAIAIALGSVALRNSALILEVLESEPDLGGSVELLRDAFDMLDEDFEEERFFVGVRRAFWAAPEGSSRRKAAEVLIARLEF